MKSSAGLSYDTADCADSSKTRRIETNDMLSGHKLQKYLGGRDLLSDVSFRIEAGEKVTLVGVNGSGKSTLMKMCAGLIEADGGEISLPKDATIGYLPQHAEMDTGRTLFEEMRYVFKDVDAHFAECEELAHKMSEVDHASPEFEKIADRYGHLQHELDRLSAYDVDARIEKILAGLGFKASDRDKMCGDFSGGWQMRIMLGGLLLRNPDVLLLDEPTNHLDLETMIWLEEWIRSSDSSVLLVSHERRFMDALASRVYEVHEGKLTIYRGNYTDYLRQREERWAQWQREYDNQLEEIAHLQKFIDRFRYNASKAAMVQSRVKTLEKIERIPPPPKPAASIHFRFPQPDRGSKEVFMLEGVSKSYGNHRVLNDVEQPFWRGEKVALVGLNGAGKSTLLKMLAGIEQPSRGSIQTGAKCRVEYFAQYDEEGIHKSNTVWQEISSVAAAGQSEQARALLGGFFFIGDDVDKLVGSLSGGERTRLRLAKMLFSGANVLLLDEPTNHLDIASRATLERAIKDYEGTVVLVSHDRAFLDSVVTRVIEIKDGGARSFHGNYEEYCQALRALGEDSPLIGASRAASPKPSVEGKTESQKKSDATEKKSSKKSAQPDPGPDPNRTLSREQQKMKKLVTQIEQEIEKVEAQLANIETDLARPEIYKDFTKCNPLLAEKERFQGKREALMSQWEQYASAL